MGYTHYMRQQRDFTPEEWAKLCAAVATITSQCGVPLANGLGEPNTAPEINGNEITLNGVEPDDYEAFMLTRRAVSDYEFCKTARKPYDLPVVAILNLIHLHYPDAIEISSDGDIFPADTPDEYDERTSALALLEKLNLGKVKSERDILDAEDHQLGINIIDLLGLKMNRANRVDTSWGDKTPAGLTRTLRRIIEGEI